MPYPIVILALAFILSACTGAVRQQPPAPVESHGQSQGQGSASGSEPEVYAYRPPQTQVAIARPQPSRAVQVLMRRADDQRRAGEHAAAAASLERALRIDPQNARLWNRLAHVRSAQQQFVRVEQLAAKSNALAGADDALVADNWDLIAQARAARGDSSGAAAARRQASVQR